jgi:hypothetical protein
MTELPNPVKQTFFKFMHGKTDIEEFEQWVYTSKELEASIPEEAYTDLISFSYNQQAARYELFKLVKQLVDLGEFEAFKLILLLKEAKLRTPNLLSILEQFYELNCHGYYFLDTLGLGYGLSMVYMPEPYLGRHWKSLDSEELKVVIENISLTLENEIDKVLGWLESGKIILTGVQDELNHYQYNDNRSDTDKVPTVVSIFKEM